MGRTGGMNLLFLLTLAWVVVGPAKDTFQPRSEAVVAMTDERLDELIRRLDAEAALRGPMRQITIEGRTVLVVSDARADRMRVMTRVAPSENLDPQLLMRMLQANFDAVLDARYAVAHDQIWSVFIHPLSLLTEEEFFSGVAQVVVAAETFGDTFSSGALVFGGGDSSSLHRELYERLKKKGKTNI